MKHRITIEFEISDIIRPEWSQAHAHVMLTGRAIRMNLSGQVVSVVRADELTDLEKVVAENILAKGGDAMDAAIRLGMDSAGAGEIVRSIFNKLKLRVGDPDAIIQALKEKAPNG